tara:strand:+ start:9705 stop:10448 length:744 start_codon:yes stop_codon:yes gene_type:complete
MLNVAFIGCSWTQGYNIPYTSTYPYIVHELLNKYKVENRVVNAGRNGSSWVTYPSTIKYINETYDADIFVVQHTTPDRGLLQFSSSQWKYQKIARDHDVYENYLQLWDNTQSYYHLTIGMAEQIIADEKSELVQHIFHEIQRKSTLTKQQIIDRVSYWYNQERHHPLNFEKYTEAVEYCNYYIKDKNKKIVNLFWLDDEFCKSFTNLPNKIVVQNEIDFKQYAIDSGYHFDDKGNKILAEVLIPQLL